MPENETANEVVVKSGRRIAVGDEWWTVRKDDAACQFIDFLTEARQFNGTVYLSLASGILDANNEPIVDVVSRLRMNLGTAQVLHNLLGQIIGDALRPTGSSKAN
ncbi:hypothetical protein [Sinorhizobium meliloti]|uniref:hypothetical protein n=1 Tax=Rhizobium meliloti TaxID=382 RepID=UPI000FD6F178|nr:hypothetical protein [Sinorhizobium meliloti]RVO08203.1 hypothetical protein CN102_11610 [Sinorhizobium meliloti]